MASNVVPKLRNLAWIVGFLCVCGKVGEEEGKLLIHNHSAYCNLKGKPASHSNLSFVVSLLLRTQTLSAFLLAENVDSFFLHCCSLLLLSWGSITYVVQFKKVRSKLL